ncbi:MAG: hypothetical protein K0S80_5336 [Neobacillus sp.]|nr:hypothetical protein [Neobacillus sp.]
MTGVLSVGIIGGVGTSAFAATSDTNAVKQTVQSLDSVIRKYVISNWILLQLPINIQEMS